MFASALARERSPPALKPPLADWRPQEVEHSDAAAQAQRSAPHSLRHSAGAQVTAWARALADSQCHVGQRVAATAHLPHLPPASSAGAETTRAAGHSELPWRHLEARSEPQLMAAALAAAVELSAARWL